MKLNSGVGKSHSDKPAKKPAKGADKSASAEPSPALRSHSKGEMAAFVAHNPAKDMPAFKFVDLEGKERTLADWKGKVILLNLWATWCAPCRKEMPALDRLQAELGGSDFEVLALNIDRGGASKAKKFLDQIKVEKLATYNEASGRVTARLRVLGMPTTLLLDREGRELGRLVGPAEWDSDDAKALIKAAIAQTS